MASIDNKFLSKWLRPSWSFSQDDTIHGIAALAEALREYQLHELRIRLHVQQSYVGQGLTI
jgi:hypothetical protein